MKYGETLHQRSPPEWEAYNVDYNEIKAIIKNHTTGAKASAITIPGQSFHDAAFEEELYRELADQHQRVDLFVRSKAGEIQRRLDHLGRIVAHLCTNTQVAERKRMSVRKLEKFSRLETDTLRAGEEIQALARYVGAQRLAFVKLLKKYRKWTGEPQLATRFDTNVVSKPRAFENQELDPLLVQYNEILASVRAPFEAGVTWKVSAENPQKATKQRSATMQTEGGTGASSSLALQGAFDWGTNVELDAAFGSLPLGKRAGHVAYWVHNENLLQLHILLLHHMRLRTGSSVSSTPMESSSQPPSPMQLVDASMGKFMGQEINGQIVCGDLETFAKGRSGKTIDQLETRSGQRPDDSAATIRYTSTGDSILVVNRETTSSLDMSCTDNFVAVRCRFKQKELQPLLQGRRGSGPSEAPKASASGAESPLPDQPEVVRSWFEGNRNTAPLVHVQAKRSRFGGLSNDGDHGVWAVLDRDVSMRQSSESDFDMREREESAAFPHAILEIRWEGQSMPYMVQQLDGSHLVERVPGFSLQVHAVATICDSDMPQPYWISILDRDIRKIPQETVKGVRRRSSLTAPEDSLSMTRPSTATASADLPSSSGFSRGQVQSSATSIQEVSLPPPAKAKRKRKSKAPRRTSSASRRKEEPRYWNEFDDGDEADGDEAYTVLVDPDTPAPLIDAWNAVAAGARGALRTLLRRSPTAADKPASERTPLLPSDYFSLPPEDPDSPSSPGSPNLVFPTEPRHRSRYRSIAPLEPLAKLQVGRRDALLNRGAAAAFLVAYAMTLMAGTLELVRRRHRYALAADVGIVFGIVASMVAAVAGVGLSAARKLDVGWMNRMQIGLAFAVICVGNGVLVVVLAGA